MSIFRLISFFFEGSIQRNRIGFVGKGIKGEQCSSNMGCPEGKLPFGQRRPEHDRDAPAFSVEKNPKKPGGFVAGNPMGTASPWHTILLARSSVLYLLRRAATEGACGGAAQGPFGGAGQAGFAGRMAENTGACEKQSPPGRQRLCALGWSEAEEKRAQPGRRRYIKTLVLR